VVTCFYLPFGTINGDSDNQPTFFDEKKLPIGQPVPVEHQTFAINCKSEQGVSVYENLHAHPLMKNDDAIILSEPTENQLSVELILLESVSLSQLRRKMPATLDYVKNKMKMFMFKSD